MPTPTPPPATPLAIQLAPHESTLLCMPAGSTLHLTSGRLALHAGPLILGQVLVSQHPSHVLDAQGGWTAPAGHATWLRVSNCTSAPATAWLTEAPAATSAWPIWNALSAGWTRWRQVRRGKREWPSTAARSH